MTATVILPNGIAIVLLLVLLSSAGHASGRSLLLDSKIFLLMVFCDIFQCTFEIISYAIDGTSLPGMRPAVLIVNSLLFIVNIVFSYLWVVYAEYKIFEDLERIKRRARFLAHYSRRVVSSDLC